jgi:hypothetical protein
MYGLEEFDQSRPNLSKLPMTRTVGVEVRFNHLPQVDQLPLVLEDAFITVLGSDLEFVGVLQRLMNEVLTIVCRFEAAVSNALVMILFDAGEHVEVLDTCCFVFIIDVCG